MDARVGLAVCDAEPCSLSPCEGPIDLELDRDGDGVLDVSELAGNGAMNGQNTDPNVLDSDDDGLADLEEVHGSGTDPLQVDTDGDGEGQRPTTHDPRPTTHDPRPTTHDPRLGGRRCLSPPRHAAALGRSETPSASGASRRGRPACRTSSSPA